MKDIGDAREAEAMLQPSGKPNPSVPNHWSSENQRVKYLLCKSSRRWDSQCFAEVLSRLGTSGCLREPSTSERAAPVGFLPARFPA